MEIFWNTIARYNAGTWPVQIVLVATAVVLTVLLYRRPTRTVRMSMKLYLALLNGWIAAVYYAVYCVQRGYSYIPAFIWGAMALVWVYDLCTGYTTFERTYRHDRFTGVLYLLPFLYPVCSLLRGLEFPGITTPVMPCCVAVYTVALLLAFSRRVNLFVILILCHWAILGLSKVYFFRMPEDSLLTCSIVPALYFFFKEYIDTHLDATTKPDARTMYRLLVLLCAVVGVFFAVAIVHEFSEGIG